MAVDYTLVVQGTMLPRALAERLGFGPEDATVVDGHWTVRTRALTLEVLRAEGVTQAWFRADKTLPELAWSRACALVERVLASGDEDLTFIAFGRHVVLERVNGVVRRLEGDFAYRAPDSILREEIGRQADLQLVAGAVVDAHSRLEARRVALALRQAADAIDERLRVPAHPRERPTPEQTVSELLGAYRWDAPPLDDRLLKLADHDALGWVRALDPEKARAAVTLLLAVAGDRDHPVLVETQRDTEFRWDDDAETWAWFGRFARRVADTVDELLAPPEPATAEHVLVEVFAAHLDTRELWGATLDQLLFAADAAARHVAEQHARAVADRLRTLAGDESDRLVLRLRVSSDFPWPELQAVARRIADRVDALVP